MTTFSLVTTILALVIFAGFVTLSVVKFGWQKSYSAFAPKWTEAVPIDNHTRLWSIVTFVVALLLAFGMIEQGEGHPWQALGFFAPLYLMVVSYTPEYQDQPGDDDKMRAKRKRQRIIHYIGTILCAAVSAVWLFLAGPRGIFFFSLMAALVAGIVTRSINSSLIFWAEMAMFGAVFAARLIGGLAL